MSNEARQLKHVIDAWFDQEVVFLQHLVRARSVNTYTANDSPPNVAVEEAVAHVIEEQMGLFGWQSTRHGLTAQRSNVLCTIAPGEERPGKVLILTTHMDTVPASADYTRNPWGAKIEHGRLYGLGAADAKAQIAAFVYAVRAVQLAGMRLTGTVKLAFVLDEETGACSPYGTPYLLEQGLLNGDAALIGEPGDEKIALGHRGLYRFRVQTQGEAIHTGLRAWEEGSKGHNAVNDMARLILGLEQCPLPFLPSPLFPGRKPVLSFPTMIRGGNAVNMVPAGCEAFGDVRVLPGMTEDVIRQTITACLDQAQVPYQFEPLMFVPAAALSEEAEIVQIVSAAIEETTGKRVRCAGAGPACDGWMFLERGIPTICGYGVACGGVHGADEWADLVSLRQITEVYAQTIVTFFQME